MRWFTKERVANGLCVFALLMAFYLCTNGCAGSRPGMPERVGGLLGAKVEDGPCLYTDTIIVFFREATDENPAAVVPIGKGCRCAYRIAGVEYFPTQVFPNEMCEEYKLKRLKEKEESNEQSGAGQQSAPAEPTSYGL